MRQARAGAALLALLLSGSCASSRAAGQAESYQRARAMLAQVEDAPLLFETVHSDPRVLATVGLFLQAADAEKLTEAQMSERFSRLIPVPPWEWAPTIEFRTVESGRYLVALGHAASTQPSSLYLFEGARHVRIDSGVSGTVQVESVHAEGDVIEVAYFPSPGGTNARLASAVIEKTGTTWRVDHDTPYARVTSLLARAPRGDIEDHRVHRNLLLLEAFGVFLTSAKRLGDADRHRHLAALFPDVWYRATPTFDIRRIGPTLYLVTIASARPNAGGGSLYLFAGASSVSLASDDTRSFLIEKAEVFDQRIEVSYERFETSSVRDAPPAPPERGHAVAVREGQAWRVVQTR